MEGIIEAHREPEGFWSPDLLLGGPMMEKRGGSERSYTWGLFLGLWAADEQGGAEGIRDLAFFITQKYFPPSLTSLPL